MNDRYLFKAKRVDNDEWIVGLLIKMCGQLHIINHIDENMASAIDEDTVCQCTGLKDKNGNLIFENDIVRRITIYGEDDNEYIEIGSVKYGDFNCSCCSGVYGWYFTGNADIREVEAYSVEGSIFDNPELLEVE